MLDCELPSLSSRKLKPPLESRRVRIQPRRRTSLPIESPRRALATLMVSIDVPKPFASAAPPYPPLTPPLEGRGIPCFYSLVTRARQASARHRVRPCNPSLRQ